MGPADAATTPFEAVLRALPGFCAHITLDGKIRFLNRLATGFTEDQIRGASIFDFTPPAYHGAMRGCLDDVVRTRQQAGFSNLAQGAYGELVPYYTLIAPLLDGERIESLVLLATDVSHVVDAHQALAASEAKLRLALEATKMGIWTYDRQRDEVTWDATLSQIFGYPAEPRTWSRNESQRYTMGAERDRLDASRARLFETGSYGPTEHRIVRRDGVVRWVSATGRVQHGDSGDPSTALSAVGGVVDITERKQQEDQLAQVQKLDSIGRLAGGVAHDFNNMLTAILGYADLCIARSQPGSPLVDDLREIKRAAERSRELTSRLLSFARKQRVEQRVIEPNAIVQQLDRLLSRIVGEDVTLTSALRATRNVRIDPHQLEQLLLNLVTNARDAMPRGGRLTIDTADLELPAVDGELAAGAYVRIRVTDTGTGISPTVLEHIFEPFFTTKEDGKGTGLGLAQCYGIARQAGGQLRVSSREGVGTEVTLDLPATTEPATNREVPATVTVTGRETVLVVEDEPAIRALSARVLRDAGYAVLEARDGNHALAVAAAHDDDIALLLTDMVMPGMSGLELADALVAQRPKLGVVVMTGYAPQLVGDHRVERVLAKPFSGAELLAIVRACLDR